MEEVDEKCGYTLEIHLSIHSSELQTAYFKQVANHEFDSKLRVKNNTNDLQFGSINYHI